MLTATAGVRRMQAFLWDAVTGPVLGALGLDHPSDEPRRLWWMPVGGLSVLPLHAAGYHDGAGRSVLDRVVSSYIPTIRALHHGRRRPAPSRRAALAVAMPATPGASDLPSAGAEADVVVRAIPDTLALSGEAATRERVLAELPGRPWAHFACHGAPTLGMPSAGRLVVHDHREHPLTVLHLGNLRLEGARLAF